MDLPNSKLVEEDEDESVHLGDNVDALNRDMEGKNYSSSEQFATLNNGNGDGNTNLHRLRIIESTQMKEEQPSVLGNLNQELKREIISLDDCQTGRLWEDPCHVPQASNLQSRNNPIAKEPERLQPQYLKLQKMSSQQAHGVEQPVDPMKHGLKLIIAVLHILVPQVDKDKAMQLSTLYYKVKGKEIAVEAFFRCMRDVVGNHMLRLAINKLPQSQQRRRMATNQSVGSTSVGGQTKSTINMTTVPNLERPTSINGPSTVQGGPISHFPNNSSLPLNSVPCEGLVTKDQAVGPSSSVVVHQESINQSFDPPQKPPSLVQLGVSNAPMKQDNANPKSNNDLEKQSSQMVVSTSTTHASFVSPSVTQLDSSTTVNFSGPFGTIPAEANAMETPKMPCVGQKKPLDTLGSSLPRSSKKQKVSGRPSVKQLNDVTALGGVNILEEEKQLLSTRPKKNSHVSEASGRVVHEEEERSILQKIPLQRKLAEIMAKSGIKHVNRDVERCLSLCVEERMRGLLSNIIRVSTQRVDAEKCRHQTFVTSDIRKQINEMNQKVKEEQEKKQAEENKLENEENDTDEKEDNSSKQVKTNKEEEDKRRANAANVAARVAVGGNYAFLKWQLMAEARKKASSGPGSNSKKPYAKICRRVGMKQGLPKVVRSISAKDVIAVLEREPQMSKSQLLYRLYSRICSDVQTQEKT